MKKQSIILSLILTLMTATVAHADCPGTPYTGSNGNSYCMGNVYMNWWSAFAWCDAIGGTLVDVTADCACSGSSCPTNSACPNLSDVSQIWTRNEYAQDTQYAYVLQPGYSIRQPVITQPKTVSMTPMCRM